MELDTIIASTKEILKAENIEKRADKLAKEYKKNELIVVYYNSQYKITNKFIRLYDSCYNFAIEYEIKKVKTNHKDI
jgi:aspartokinase